MKDEAELLSAELYSLLCGFLLLGRGQLPHGRLCPTVLTHNQLKSFCGDGMPGALGTARQS